MADWLDNLEGDERHDWDRFVEHFRRDTLEKISGSAATISIVPRRGGFDVKFAVELGASIMLDKPILAIAQNGADVPLKLRTICDVVVIADIDTEEGRNAIARAIDDLMKGLS